MNNLSINLITRNNADSIVDCLNSTLPCKANEYIVCDTGSTDNTIDLIAGWGFKNKKKIEIVFYKDKYGYDWNDKDFWQYDFGKARQMALEETTTPYMLWLDSDDILEGAEFIQQKIMHMEAYPQIDQILFPYRYGVDQHNNDIVLHWRERLIRVRPETKWTEPVHEYIKLDHLPVLDFDENTKWRHKRKPEHVRRTSRRNREILRYQYNQTNKQNAKAHLRLLQNLAFDHFEHKEWSQASEFYSQFFARFGSLPANNPDKQQHQMQLTHNILNWARAELEQTNYAKAEELLNMTKNFDELDRSIYLMLAELRLRQEKVEAAVMYLEQAERIQQKPSLLPINQVDLAVRPNLLWVEIFKRTVDFENALIRVEKAMQIVPTDRGLQEEHKILLRNLEQKRSFDGYYSLKNELLNTGDWKRMDSLLSSIPDTIKNQSSIKEELIEMKKQVEANLSRLKTKLPAKKRIAIYTGPAFEKWAGDSRVKGIGGSEEMVIGIAKELQALGNEVFVYNDCGSKAGIYDGVEYIDYKSYKPTMKFDVLIVSRIPQMFAQPNGKDFAIITHSSKRQYLWLHDASYGALPTISFGLADKILVLSEYQRDLISRAYSLPKNKFVVTRNGIDISAYKKLERPERNPKQIIYCSSYDRGLYEFLTGLKEIRKEVPDVVAKVYYGWDTYDKRMAQMPPNFSDHPSQLSMRDYKERCVQLMSEMNVQDGGRIGQEQLYLEMCKSNVWFYPTWFHEISCITAMRAQYAGAIPVVTPVAALNETVKVGFKLGQDEGIKKVIELLKNPDEKLRAQCIEAGKSFGLKELAAEWNNIF